MNILFTNNQEFNPQIGGVEKVSCILAEEFIKLGHRVSLAAYRRSEYGDQYKPVAKQLITSDPKELSELLIENGTDVVINQAGNDREYSDLVFDAVDIANGKKPDDEKIRVFSEIHTDPMFLFKTYRYTGDQGIKKLIKNLALPFRDLVCRFRLKQEYMSLFQKSEGVILLSETYKNDLGRLIGKELIEKAVAIPNPCGYRSVIDSKRQEFFHRKKSTVLFIGRIDNGKNLHSLLRIWKIVKKYPISEEWDLKILGDGPLRNIEERFVMENSLENVHFKDYCDPEKYYLEASVICMTSRFEGLPMALIEGMTMGNVPVVYNSFEAASDIIRDSENGYLIKNEDEKSFSKALLGLMKRPELLKKMSFSAMESAERFERKRIAVIWTEYLEK